jgi:nicotinamide-nucleotide amidase
MEQARILKQICDDSRLLVATAESVTVGHLQSLIASVSGASTFFRGGITAYNIEEKVGILGVERAHAELVDCVSSQVAAEMALGATRLFDAHIGLATTGYAEPPDLPNSPVAYAFYAIWDKRESRCDPIRSGKLTSGNPDRVKNQCLYAELVMRELVSYLCSREDMKVKCEDVFCIERLPNGGYRLGDHVVDDILHIDGAVKAVKRSIPIAAFQVNQPFEVLTTEGTMQGKPGDWLMQGVVGEVYVCPDEIFRRSYDYPL